MLEPPAPLILNPREPKDFPLGRWNLYIGGAGRAVNGFVNLDLFPVPGVDVAADAHQLPFGDDLFQRVECDAVLEHVRRPEEVMREIRRVLAPGRATHPLAPVLGPVRRPEEVMRETRRVLAPGGYAHLVTPFCHPFHEYPKNYRRFTIDGLKELAGDMEVVAAGWRTGPTATALVFTLEYVKLLLPWRAWRVVSHGVLGWGLFPLRYIDLLLFRSPDACRLGNHCYLWVRKK